MRNVLCLCFIIVLGWAAIDVLNSELHNGFRDESPSRDVETQISRGSLRSGSFTDIDSESVQLLREEILSTLESIHASKDSHDLIESKAKLEALLRARPAEMRQLVEPILSETTPPRSRLAMIHSLGAIGSAESEGLLIDLGANVTLATAARVQAVVTLAEASQLQQTTISRLWNLTEDGSNQEIAHAALLNLGISAASLAHQATEQSAGIVERLISLASHSLGQQNSAQLALIMDSLGNAGSDRVLPFAEKLLQSPLPNLRVYGVTALRLVASKRAEDFILDIAANDPSADVRAAAAEALTVRRPTEDAVKTVARLIEDEEDSTTRRHMIAFLGGRAREFALSHDTLRALLQRENHPENYSLAIRYLSTQ